MTLPVRSARTLAHSLLFVAAMLFAAGWQVRAAAQSYPADPPARVARLADLQGQVWVYRPDVGDWVSAVRNTPLTTGDHLATDPGARAEVQVGSTTVRLDGGTEVDVQLLDDRRFSLQLLVGAVSARVRETADAGTFDVRTEEGRFVAQRAGRYRIDRSGRSTFITVTSGLANYEGSNSGLAVQPGQRAEFFIDANGVAQYAVGVPLNDAFAAWSGDRDRRVDNPAPARYVSPEMTGADDLDRYGRWEQSPDYGALWIPANVATGWVPYSTGHWVWVRPWGWTWVDEAPWGFAPFHYGRWVYVRNYWCWSPGVRVVRPVYAPALVAWVGEPVSIDVGGGRSRAPSVGWFPLAPREVYVPAYHASPRYTQNINVTQVTNITNITTVINNPQVPREFQNRHVANAVTVVPVAVMTERQPVAAAAAQWRQSPGNRDAAARSAQPAPVLLAAPVAAPVVAAPRSTILPVHREDPRATGVPAGDRGRGVAEPPPGAREPGRPATPPVIVATPLAPRPPSAASTQPIEVRPSPAASTRPPPARTDDGRAVGAASMDRMAPPPLPRPTPPAAPLVAPPAVPAQVAAPAPVTRPAPSAPAARPPVPRDAADRVPAAAPAAEVPAMRTQPVRRGDERAVPPRVPDAVRSAEPARAEPHHVEPPKPKPAEAAPRARVEPAKEPSAEPRPAQRGERER